MKISDFPSIEKTLSTSSQKYRDHVNAAMDLLANGVRDGEVINARYKEAKDTIGRQIESAYNAGLREMILDAVRLDREDAALNDLYYSHVTVANYNATMKRIAKLADGEIKTAYAAFMIEIKPLVDAILFLKDKVVKRLTRTEEEKREAAYTPPVSKVKSAEIVKGILEDVVAKSYNNMIEKFVAEGLEDAQAFLKASQEVRDGSIEKPKWVRRVEDYSPYDFCSVMINGRRATDSEKARIIVMQVAQDGYSGPYSRKPDADAKLLEDATKRADHIRLTYVVKNLKKIVSILETKGDDNFKSATPLTEANIGWLTGSMRIEFNDGSSFVAVNSVVFASNSFGTNYVRFPLTFHNVVMPDGTKMKGPSEKAMNTTFVGK